MDPVDVRCDRHGLTIRDIRDRERIQCGKCTLRITALNFASSVGDKPVGELLFFRIRAEIDDRN